MKKEYDFSKAVQGKFYRLPKELEIPVYLDNKVKEFFLRRAGNKKNGLENVVNKVLRKEIELIKAMEKSS